MNYRKRERNGKGGRKRIWCNDSHVTGVMNETKSRERGAHFKDKLSAIKHQLCMESTRV
jgi:hypothetical protein